MTIKVVRLLIVFQLIFTGIAFAQQTTTSPKGKYLVHTIEKGETIFSICKKYNIEQKDLLDANPSLSDGLKTGQTLNIPQKEEAKKQEKKEADHITHTVVQGETLYSLSKQFHVSVDEIIKYNPEAKEGVKVGQILKIPGFATIASTGSQSIVKQPATTKKDYIEYEVEEGDTFFGLMRKFNITRQQLQEANPDIQPDIKVGQTLKIPTIKNEKENTSVNDKYIQHKVEAGETIYGLSTEYDVKVFEIMELNPSLKEKGLSVGDVILIPRKDEKKAISFPKYDENKDVKNDKSPKPTATRAAKNDTFNITMFLPLFLSQNEAMNSDNNDDSITYNSPIAAPKKKERSLYSHSRNFLSFYEGFLVALDTMKKTGININVDVYDSQFKQSVVDSVMRKKKTLNADLIVGPVDVKHQKNISAFSYKNQIPLVSPFSSDDDYVANNPFYFQINPTKDYIYRKTAEYIGREYWNKNVVVMTPYSFEQLEGGDIIELTKEKMLAYASKHSKSKVTFSRSSISEGYWEVKDNLKKDEENIIFILPSTSKTEKEAILSRAINSLYALSEDYNITIVGTSDYPNFKSINTEYFHKLNLHYLTPNFVDYSDPEVNSFIRDYRKKFRSEPNQFSYRGYDVAKFFLEAYREQGRNYINKISSLQINTLQSNMKLKRAKEFSGFVNRSLFVVNFTPDFDVKAVSTINE